MRIAVLIEGKTEKAFKQVLIAFLRKRLADPMPKLDFAPYDGRIPKAEKLRRIVQYLLSSGARPADHVIALTDVYTGTNDFADADDAKAKMTTWVGDEHRFHAHAAQHEFEAWLLPYWPRIQELAGHNKRLPAAPPESIDHQKPPSHWIKEIFRIGSRGQAYVKARDGMRILRDQDLTTAALACTQFKAFLNTILRLSGGDVIQ